MKIAITGTPGTGKTEISRVLAKDIGYSLITINEFAKDRNLIIEKDKERDSDIIDEKKLKKESEKIEDNTIIEGHLAHYTRSDLTIVLRTNPEELEKRLKERKWSKNKIEENIQAEALDIILQESAEEKNNICEIDTTGRTPEEIKDTIKQIINDPKIRPNYAPGRINWEKYIKLT